MVLAFTGAPDPDLAILFKIVGLSDFAIYELVLMTISQVFKIILRRK